MTQINLTNIQIEKLNLYIKLLKEESTKQSLIGLSTINNIEHWHFLDGYQIYDYIHNVQKLNNIEIVDIGSGAGIPGIIIAICAENNNILSKIHLVEPRKKRIEFLQHVVKTLDLQNIIVHPYKAVKLNFIPQYIVERGVGPIDWLKQNVPYNKNTIWYLLKGSNIKNIKNNKIKIMNRWRDCGGVLAVIKNI